MEKLTIKKDVPSTGVLFFSARTTPYTQCKILNDIEAIDDVYVKYTCDLTASSTGSIIVDPHTWLPIAIHLSKDPGSSKGVGVTFSAIASYIRDSNIPGLDKFGDILDDDHHYDWDEEEI